MLYRIKYAGLPLLLAGGLGAWLLVGYAGHSAQPVHPATSVLIAPTQPPGRDGVPASNVAGDQPLQISLLNPATSTSEAITPVETAPVDGLKIASQSWRRGGLGSNALVTFTLRNVNDYAVKDIELFCSFSRNDGTHLTDRKRTIHDIISMRSRKTFARLHVGFVNINADQAKCSLVAASRT